MIYFVISLSFTKSIWLLQNYFSFFTMIYFQENVNHNKSMMNNIIFEMSDICIVALAFATLSTANCFLRHVQFLEGNRTHRIMNTELSITWRRK